MIGDVNLFLSTSYDSEDEESIAADRPAQQRAELELMIAMSSSRRKGYGIEALQIFISYASEMLSLPPSSFFAKIGTSNEGSIQLFERLGFKKGKISIVFEEVEMIWGGGETWSWEKNYETIDYIDNSP